MEKDISLESYTLHEIAQRNRICSYYDTRITELYHIIEDGRPNAAQGAKLLKKLKAALVSRRRYKRLIQFMDGGSNGNCFEKVNKEVDEWTSMAGAYIAKL